MSRAPSSAGSVRAKAATFRRLPAREQLTTIRALLTVAVVEVGVRIMPLPRLAALLGVHLDSSDPDRGGPAATRPVRLSPTERRQLRVLRRVMRNWLLAPGPCLRESLVLGHFWRRRHPSLRIGVAKLGRGLGAHAWLVVDGVPLGAQESFQALRWHKEPVP